MNKYLFNDLHQWKVCMAAALSHLWWGLHKIITNTIFGLVSLFLYIGNIIEDFCKRETKAAFTIGTILTFLIFGWLGSYVKSAGQIKSLEYQRDSVSIRLDRVMRTYDKVQYKDVQTLREYDIQGTNGELD